MLSSFCNQPIVRIRGTLKDSRGSMIYDWNSTTEITINNCSIQPISGSIDINGRVLGLTNTYNVYVDTNADVHAGDRINFNSQIFEVTMEPMIWQSPSGRLSHKEFSIVSHKG